MTDIQAEDHAGETSDAGGGEAAGEERDGTLDAAPGGDASGGTGDTPGDESAAGTGGDGGRPAGAEEPAPEPAAGPEDRLRALAEDIDAVRRRVEDDTVDEGDERFVQEGEASEDEPVDDTIAPPG